MKAKRSDSIPRRKIFAVDDDRLILRLFRELFERAGYEFIAETSSRDAVARIKAEKPDIVLLDIMMPDIDGLEICAQLKKDSDLGDTKIIVVSGKSYEFDRKQAMKLGADGFVTKTAVDQAFLDQIERIAAGRIDMAFWGVRGTLPVPGKNSLKYGGNTSCVSLEFANGALFIFDAGSGIKVLSDHLLAAGRSRIEAKIFISHPHWDHINALPFFVPLYAPGNAFEICGARNGDIGMREIISAQMDDVYFPITIREFGAHVTFRDLREESFEIDGVSVSTMLLSHPGYCLGYRIEYAGRSICYITDNELYRHGDPSHNPHYVKRLVDFVAGADALITDATYTDAEYAKKIGWGHSCIGEVVDLAHAGKVKTLYLFHHDPDQTDDDIDAKLETARSLLKEKSSTTKCLAPKEGGMVKL